MSAVRAFFAFSAISISGLALAAPLPPEKARLIAHRGESLEAPANGLEAFRLAFADGFGVAFEVALSPEGLVLTRPSPKTKPCGLDEALALVPADVRIAFTTADDRGKVAALVRAVIGRHPQIRMENVILPGEADLPFANAPDEAARLIANGAKAVLSDSPRRLLMLWDEAFAEPPPKDPNAYRLMLFNIWGPFFGNPVAEREDGVVTTILRESPDVVALQETTPEWWASGLFAKLTDDYGVVEGGWERTNNHHNPNPILYRKTAFEVVASGREVFHWKLDYSKGYTWAIFREKATGRCFTAFSTHFWWRENGQESDTIRLWDAEQLVRGLDRVRHIESTPVIGGGDFNAKFGSDALTYLFDRGFSDAQRIAKVSSPDTSWHDDPVRDWRGRYRGFVPRANVAADQSLDHVIVSAGVEVLRQRIVRHPAAMDVSDHSPVVVDFALRENATGTLPARCL